MWLLTGANYLALRVVTDGRDPIAVAFLRMAAAALVMLPIAFWRLTKTKRPTLRQVGSAALLGVLLMGAPQLFLTIGVSILPSGVTAVLGSSAPLFLALFAWAIVHDPLTRRQLAGVGLGFAGLVLLMVAGKSSGTFELTGLGAMLVYAITFAAGSLYGGRTEGPGDPLVSLCIQLVAATPFIGIAALFMGSLGAIDQLRLDNAFWASFAFAVLGGSIGAFGLFTWLNSFGLSTAANSVSYAAPVVALALGTLVLGEELTVAAVIASLLAVSGVGLMVSRKAKPD